ncbi:MAG: hypothetical protein M3382_01285 [Thermoproteota archaeon]|nr:hypothetical protein [Thermoproteota archaeon]
MIQFRADLMAVPTRDSITTLPQITHSTQGTREKDKIKNKIICNITKQKYYYSTT